MIAGVVLQMMSSRAGWWLSVVCQGNPVRQSLGGVIHHAQKAGDVVRQFYRAALSDGIDVGETTLQIAAAPEREDGGHGPGQDRAVLVVLRRVVRSQEVPPIEREASRWLSHPLEFAMSA